MTENHQTENLVTGPSKAPKIHLETLDEINTSLRKEIMSDVAREEILKLKAPTSKNSTNHQNIENSDS